MKIVTVLPTYNRKDKLKGILECLNNQKLSDSISLEKVVVVDGSTDGTTEFLNEVYKDVHQVHGDGSWFYTKSMNQGFKYAEKLKPDYILTLNDDLELTSNYIQTIFDDVKSYDGDCVIGSLSVTKETPHRVTFSGISSYTAWSQSKKYYIPKLKQIDINEVKGIYTSPILFGRGMMIPYRHLKDNGFFDEKFIQYGSDSDFALRMHILGIKVLISHNAIVFEHHKETSVGSVRNNPDFKEYVKSIFNKYSINSYSKTMRFYRKHGSLILYPFYAIYNIFKLAYNFYKNK